MLMPPLTISCCCRLRAALLRAFQDADVAATLIAAIAATTPYDAAMLMPLLTLMLFIEA